MTDFNISTLATTLAEGSVYSFSITPKTSLASAIKVRWEIVADGKIPISADDFASFTGVVDFAASATAAQTVRITATDDSALEPSQNFQIRIYQVVGDDDSTTAETDDILLGAQAVRLDDNDIPTPTTPPTPSLFGDSTPASNAEGNVNTAANTQDFSLNAKGGNDTYIITRYQSGDVKIAESAGIDLIKFDFGVFIERFGEVSTSNFTRLKIEATILTLSTGAKIEIEYPDRSTSFQLGDGEIITSYAAFKIAIGASGTNATSTLESHDVTTFTTTPDVSANTIAVAAEVLESTGSSDVIGLGGVADVRANGAGGDDTFVITRFQTGDVEIDDTVGTNLIKFDFGVSITGFAEISRISFGQHTVSLATLTLSTGAEIEISFPAGAFRFQLGDATVIETYAAFKTAIGASGSNADSTLPNTYKIVHSSLIISPSAPVLALANGDDAGATQSATVAENTSSATAIITLAATDVNGGALTYALEGDDAVLFDISATGALTFKASPDFEGSGDNEYVVTVKVTDTGGLSDSTNVSVTVTNTNDAPTGLPTISGTSSTLRAGQALTVDTSAIADVDGLGTFQYQWLRNGADIALAFNSRAISYMLTSLDVGQAISVRVSYIDGGTGGVQAKGESVTSVATADIRGAIGTVVITGTPVNGETVTADLSGLVDLDARNGILYQWLVSGRIVYSSILSNTYTLKATDVSGLFSVRVSYQGLDFAPHIATSAAITTFDFVTGGVTVSGTDEAGMVLTASTAKLTDVNSAGFSFQWYNSKSGLIVGATALTYELALTDTGDKVSVRVVYTNTAGASKTARSEETNPIVNPDNNAPIGVLTTSGTPTQGELLTADTSGLADDDGLGSAGFNYFWLRDGVAIPGETSATYRLTQEDVGTKIQSFVNYTDAIGTVEDVQSTKTASIANANDAATGAPTIISEAVTPPPSVTIQGITFAAKAGLDVNVERVGFILATSGGRYIDYNSGFNALFIVVRSLPTYDALLAFINGSAHTTSRYTVTLAEGVSGTDAPDAAIFALNRHSLTTHPAGAPARGETLTADTSGIADIDGLGGVTFNYQWLRAGNIISGATAITYDLATADIGKTIAVLVTFTDALGGSESFTSASTLAILNAVNNLPTGAVTISSTPTSTPTQNGVLTADVSTLEDADGLGTLSYEWLRGGVVINGATNTTYTLTQADVGTLISVRVSYIDDSTRSEVVTSERTIAIVNVNDAPTGAVTISNPLTPTQNEMLTAVSTLADVDSLTGVTFNYQWLRAGVNIENATNATYTLTQADVAKAITVQVSYTDALGGDNSVTSEPTALVANVNDAPTGAVTVTADTPLEVNVHGIVFTAKAGGTATKVGFGNFVFFAFDAYVSANTLLISYDANNPALNTLGKILALLPTDVDISNNFVLTTDVASYDETARSAVLATLNNGGNGYSVFNLTSPIEVGTTLTADASTLADVDGLGSGGFTYAWLSDGTVISGAQAATYTVTKAEAGKAITARVSYTDGASTDESVTSVATALVAALPDAPATALALYDQVETLAENADTTARTKVANIVITDVDGGFATTLGGADAALFEISGNELYLKAGAVLDFETNPALDVTVLVTDTALSTALQITVTNADDGDSVYGVTGTLQVGQTLTAAQTTADPDVLVGALSYQWQAQAVGATTAWLDITNATASTYTLTASEQGDRVRVKITYTDKSTTAETVYATASGGVQTVANNDAAGTITVSEFVPPATVNLHGLVFTAKESLTDLAEQRIRIFEAAADDISYTSGSHELGISVVSGTYTNLGGLLAFLSGDGEVTSRYDVTLAAGVVPSDAVVPALFTSTVSLVITAASIGAPAQGKTLKVDVSALADTDGLTGVTFNYQWLRGGVEITDAREATYDLEQADVGALLSVRVSFVDALGSYESVTSAATSAIANVDDAASALAISNPVASLSENVERTARVKVADLDVTDVDGGFAFKDLTGEDSTLFEIVGNVLYLRAGAALDFSTNPSLNVTVAVTDTTLTQNLSITVTDGDLPLFTSIPTKAVPEDIAANVDFYAALATPPSAGQTVSYSLLTTGDGAAFNINADGGAVSFKASPDHSVKASYTFTIRASVTADGTTQTADQVITLAVAPPPVIIASDYTEFKIGAGVAADVLDASAKTSAQLIQGGAAADTITASAFGDAIIGGAGDDTITLGAGADIVVHGFTSAGTDIAAFQSGGDTVSNFKRGADKLVLADGDTVSAISSINAFTTALATASGQEITATVGSSGALNGKITSINMKVGGVKYVQVDFNTSNPANLQTYADVSSNFSVAKVLTDYAFFDDLFGAGSLDVVAVADLGITIL